MLTALFEWFSIVTKQKISDLHALKDGSLFLRALHQFQPDIWSAFDENILQQIQQGFLIYFKSATHNQIQTLTTQDTLHLVLCVALTCENKIEHIIQITKLEPQHQQELMLLYK